jgi:cell division protein FtsN
MNKRVCMSFGCLCILLAGFFSGCETIQVEFIQQESPPSLLPLQPITAALVRSMGINGVSGYQYYLSSPVILSREQHDLTGRNNGGALRLDNTYTRETITFDGNTKGEIIEVETNPEGKLTLIACFGSDTKLGLRFVQTGDEGCFDLETRNGTTSYNGKDYRVLHAEKLTRLLISIDGKNTIRDERRTAPGRNLDDEKKGGFRQNNRKDPETILPPTSKGQAAPQDSSLPPIVSPPPTSEHFAMVVPMVYIGNSIDDLPSPVLPESLSKATPLSAAPVLPESPPQATPLPATPVAGPHRIQVQVGAYKDADNARQAIERLNAVGFNSDYVRKGEHYRVSIVGGVPAEDIADVKSRLSSAGFDKPWIWAEY